MKASLVSLSLCYLLAGCSRHDSSQSISGTWVFDGSARHGINTVSRDGSYTGRVWTTNSDQVLESVIEGRWEVRDGVLVDTMLKHSDTNAVLPTTLRARIIKHSDQELVLQWDGMDNTAVLRKEAK